MLELCQVSKLYPGQRALREVSFSLAPGQLVGLFGENGAGKTTLLKCILGLLPYQGRITLDGAAISRRNIARFSFASCEHTFFPELTPLAHREFYRAQFPRFNDSRFQGLLDFFQLRPTRALNRCSSGQQNQFELVLALSQGADYILMDEPFAGSDIFNREDFYKLLLGLLTPTETVLLSTHLLEEVAPWLSRALLLRQGQLIGDINVQELAEQGESLLSLVAQAYQYRPERVSQALADLGVSEDKEGEA